MSASKWWDQARAFSDPLDVSEALLDCREADATWAALVDQNDDTPACAALRRVMADRARAWELCAKEIEIVALGHLLHRQWGLAARFADWAVRPGAGAAGPIYETAAGWLAGALLRIEESGGREADGDDL